MPVESVELASVLGGWLVRGSLTLLSGEPGIGKSTLTLQLAEWCASEVTPVLYVSGEEGEEQIAGRAHRLGINNRHIHFLHGEVVENIIATLQSSPHPIVIIDSVSVMYSDTQGGVSGGVAQLRSIAEIFMHFAKTTNTAVILIWHVTKDGDLAGPKTLEHLVDTVLFLEGDRYQSYRILRALKNRFWPTDAIWLFEMGESGLRDLKNPAAGILQSSPQIGSALTIALEGNRPIVLEIEALTHSTRFPYPKRSSRGIVTSKIELLLAALWKFGRVNLDGDDVYLNVGHGLSVGEPGVDLAVIAALLSSDLKKPTQHHLFLWEISLTGSIKPVAHIEKRLEEAEKLGFKVVHVSKSQACKPRKKIQIIYHIDLKEFVSSLKEA
jgi:DNA repair protein RadA/Sms